MSSPPRAELFRDVALDPEAKALRLRRFLGPALHEDEEQAALWRDRSDAEHARAGAELSDMAAQIAVATGHDEHSRELPARLSGFRRTDSRPAS